MSQFRMELELLQRRRELRSPLWDQLSARLLSLSFESCHRTPAARCAANGLEARRARVGSAHSGGCACQRVPLHATGRSRAMAARAWPSPSARRSSTRSTFQGLSMPKIWRYSSRSCIPRAYHRAPPLAHLKPGRAERKEDPYRFFRQGHLIDLPDQVRQVIVVSHRSVHARHAWGLIRAVH